MDKVQPLRGYSDEEIFYVYVHKRPTDGIVFYVGKGNGRRAWVTKSRNNHWDNVVSKHGGFDVEIIFDNLTEQEAFRKEAELITKIGMDNLTNQTLGGISTTGFKHSEETRKLQQEIAKQRLKDNPELEKTLRDRLSGLHDRQRNDVEYIKKLSEAQKEYYASLTDEEKKQRAAQRIEWQKDPEKRAKAQAKLKLYRDKKETRDRLSEQLTSYWRNMTPEQREKSAKRSSEIINSPEVRAKLMEVCCDKIVINRKYLCESKKQAATVIGYADTGLYSSLSKAKVETSNYSVQNGYFLERYEPCKHTDLIIYSDNMTIEKLDIEFLNRKSATTRDDGVVFLSRKEAAISCNGRGKVEASADFITKNMKLNKAAFGYIWRPATEEEIDNEVFKRLERAIKNND